MTTHMDRTLLFFCFLFTLSLKSLTGQAQRLDKQQAAALAKAEYLKQAELQKSKLQTDWKRKQVDYEAHQMKFEYKIFGEKPSDGRSLYISMHGGGGTTAAVNDQQWKNQISLYTPKEGVYLAPRAPTNNWNLWHEAHIDTLFGQLIKAAILMEGVNPDKIYLMGYSAGGDGTFQMAPRMADHWAAAAMMAGHPGDASALNLRNLPFAIYMGEKDAAYHRNELAAEWGKKLDSLEQANPGSFKHDLHIFAGMPHWMGRKDTIAIPWLAAFRRDPLPKKVSWVQDDVHRRQFYWLGVPAGDIKTAAKAIVSVSGNDISIEYNDHPELLLYLNDQLLDLDKKIKVIFNGRTIFRGKVPRSRSLIAQTASSLDPGHIFSAGLRVLGKKVSVLK